MFEKKIIINYLIDVVRKNEFVCNECMNKYGYYFFKIWIFVVCGVFICWLKVVLVSLIYICSDSIYCGDYMLW